MTKTDLVPFELVKRAILLLRGYRVLLDRDLATLYEVDVKVLNQAVKRNLDRFPDDFMFQLTIEEARRSRSQSVTLDAQPPDLAGDFVPRTPRSRRGGNMKYLPCAFTEQGVAMLSSVLRSPRAVQVNIEIVRAFVRLRQIVLENTELARKLALVEKKFDAQFRVVFDAIRDLVTPPLKPTTPIGFRRDPP